jgi:hypothetical protein
MAVKVDAGPASVAPNVNIPFVSVKICAPGSTTVCQTIDHILLDTASTGFRVIASVLDTSMVLPSQTDDMGEPLAECAAFISGYIWGAVRLADVQLGDQTASSLPIHVIADSAYPTIPSDCSSRAATDMNTVQAFGANGVLGVSSFIEDCGPNCAQSAIPGSYYVCGGSTCTSVTVTLARQVQNPVAALGTDNNGFVVEMDSVPAAGAATASGSLILGLGTRSNNGLGGMTKFDLDGRGDITTFYNNNTLSAFIDTGSNGLFFPDSSIAACVSPSGWFCPTSTLTLSGVIHGATNGATANVDFSIANAKELISAHPTYTAYSNIGGDGSGFFDWGLPFFYGRRVAVAFEQRTAPLGVGPYVAF